MAKNKKQDISSIDRLFYNIGKYRNSQRFREMLKFYAKFHYLGVYNAALVEQQRPGAMFVATAEQWKKKYRRKIKLDARPVIILMPFYPVDFLFDINDTEPESDALFPSNDDELLKAITEQFKAETTKDSHRYTEHLMNNLPKYGIHFQKMLVGATNNAKIQLVNQQNQTSIKVKVSKEQAVRYNNYFTISIDAKADEPSMLASTFHELGHLFCHHIPSPTKWWEQRSLNTTTEEFEAEIVSHLVCERMGIKTNSEKYLAGYVNENSMIPPIRIEHVFDAVDEIEKMIKKNLRTEDCLLYKNDKEFQEQVKKIRAEEKAKKETKKNRL